MTRIWEVFRQERRGQPFEHAGSLAAPDGAFADAYAHEQYGRRGESARLWVVPRDAIRTVDDFPDELGRKPVRSQLVHALVELDREYAAASPRERWEDWYAARLPQRV